MSFRSVGVFRSRPLHYFHQFKKLLRAVRKRPTAGTPPPAGEGGEVGNPVMTGQFNIRPV